jgi:hypothetical protein
VVEIDDDAGTVALGRLPASDAGLTILLTVGFSGPALDICGTSAPDVI